MEDEIDLKGYFLIIKRHLFLIIVIFIIVCGSIVTYTNYQPPVYEASTTIGIFERNQVVNPFGNIKQQIDIETYKAILQSNVIINKVTKETGIIPEVYNLEIEGLRNSNIIRITVESNERIIASVVANAIAAKFIEYNIEGKQKVVLEKKAFLESQLFILQEELRDLNKKLLNYEIKVSLAENKTLDKDEKLDKMNIERDIEVKSRLYSQILLTSEEIKMAIFEDTGEISIIDNAVLPIYPIKPNKPLNYMLAVVIGLFAAIAVAILINPLKGGFNSIEFIEKATGINVLGTVRKIKQKGRKLKKYCAQELSPHSSSAEQIRKLRTNLSYILKRKAVRFIAVTSPNTGDGKTTICINLAISEAHCGKKVLLIDTNLRTPMLKTIFLPKEKSSKPYAGLTDILYFNKDISNAVHKTQISNLDIMTTGSNPINKKQAFSSKQIKDLVRELDTFDYDYVFFDTTSMEFSDFAPILSAVNNVILVLNHSKTKKEQLKETKKQLHDLHAKTLGIIVNEYEK
ncbi:MAG: polysaccharide biosynthesis tyrosine autokinase [Nanoarchaeota archaeon]|nr:polysaccharide biosynthesis tyrosine autokinase [Nanoarchaeota archaeon]